MAKRRQPLVPGWLMPGLLAAMLMLLVATLALGTLWHNAPSINISELWQDAYLHHVIRFTFWQALLSTLCSTIPAIPLAQALFRRRFYGRTLLLKLCTMTLVLPVLVAVFGVISIYGRQGWLAQACQFFGIHTLFSPYGLSGILLTHVFFNLPLAARLLLQALNTIPTEQRQLAAQLGMTPWQQFYLLEWPYLYRQLLASAALIFMLCFASFATVLTLGGGPQATTIELAIYQALSYDYDLGRAALLALIQLSCCLGLVLCSQKLNGILSVGHTRALTWRDPRDSRFRRCCDTLILLFTFGLIAPPLFAVIVDGFNHSLTQVITQNALWQAVGNSLIIALGAGLLAVILSLMLLWSSRQLQLNHKLGWAHALDTSGMLILAMPGIVLATGFFLLLNNTTGVPQSPYALVILTNALMAIPYALKVLEHPMRDLAERYNPLCLSLNLHGIARLRWIELSALRRPIAQALAFACVLSVGDFGIVALFGNEQFRTLPFYLYQQIGAYRTQQGAASAFLLLLLCFSLFSVLECLSSKESAQ